jgi:hypothetical protein
VHRQKRALNIEVNVKPSSLKCSMRNKPCREMERWMGFHHGGRDLETVHVRWIHVGVTWYLTIEACRTLEGHKF